MSPAATIVLLNALTLVFCYFWMFPRVVGKDLQKLALNDVMASVVVICVAASLYVGRDISISVMGIDFNWFWFTLISYFAMEVPFTLWYMMKYRIEPPE
ncbi:hypothetical protein [Pseudohongiella nitratireducens]|uniref:hypothetical protein n=1 Tax=Pseudohongiella nitratireducens TaxID=1768907 RepID=UPI0030EF45B9|tara:strand:+ start:10266 stop:10562 length:297 start_codon:yes stop_codon:yes gene_type:complete